MRISVGRTTLILLTIGRNRRRNSLATCPDLVEVEISPSIIQRINFTRRFVQVMHIDTSKDNGWIPANLCFDTEQEAREYMLRFGDQVKIITVSLRKSVRDMAEGVVDLYNEN